MFMLSRDRLNMDLEKSSLELMLGLMSVDDKQHRSASSGSSKDYETMKEKIRRIIESVRHGNTKEAKNWQIDTISVSLSSVFDSHISYSDGLRFY